MADTSYAKYVAVKYRLISLIRIQYFHSFVDKLYKITNRTRLYYKYVTVIYIYMVKCSRYRTGVAHRLGRGIALLFHARGTRRG